MQDYRLRSGWFLDKYKGTQIFHYKSRFPDFETRHISKFTFFRQLLWRTTFKTKLYSSNGLTSAGYKCCKKFFHCNHWGTSVSQKKRIQPSKFWYWLKSIMCKMEFFVFGKAFRKSPSILSASKQWSYLKNYFNGWYHSPTYFKKTYISSLLLIEGLYTWKTIQEAQCNTGHKHKLL